MESKAPTLLLVLVDTAQLRWFVAGIGVDGQTVTLLCSEPNDLEKYRALDFDEQVAFLRHRFCGVLQRGCDRLWARQRKACQFVFVFDGLLPEATGQLLPAVANHFTEWMLNPPVIVFVGAPTGQPPLQRLAGQMEPALEALLLTHLKQLLAAREEANAWELARKDGVWCVRKDEG